MTTNTPLTDYPDARDKAGLGKLNRAPDSVEQSLHHPLSLAAMSDNDLPVTETQRWNHFHIQPIHTIALSADCHFLAAASADGTISIMDLVHNLPPHIAHFDIGTVPVAISWMPGCRLVVFASSGLLLLADVNATDAVSTRQIFRNSILSVVSPTRLS